MIPMPAAATDRLHLSVAEARALAESAMRGIGYEPEEVIGQLIENIIPQDVRSHIRANLDRVMKDGIAEGV